MSIQVGNYGFIFEETIVDEDGLPINLSAATCICFTFEKPDGTEILCSGTFSTNGIDGKVRYVVENTLFTVAGVWQYQMSVITSARNWKTEIASFFVEELI